MLAMHAVISSQLIESEILNLIEKKNIRVINQLIAKNFEGEASKQMESTRVTSTELQAFDGW